MSDERACARRVAVAGRHKRARALRRVIFLVSLCVLLIAGTATPARANYLQSGWITTYDTGTWCIDQITHLSHSSTYRGGFFRGGVHSATDLYSTNCRALGYKAATNKSARQEIFKWNGSSWALCKKNPSTDYAYKSNVYRFEYDKGYTSTLCGSGYYTLGTVEWAYINGAWRGGQYIGLWDYSSQWSHYLPSS